MAALFSDRVRCIPIQLIRRYGQTPEERILNWMGTKIKEALGSADATFAQVQPDTKLVRRS